MLLNVFESKTSHVNKLSICGLVTILVNIFSLQVEGDITYNGYKLDEFVPQKTSAYISQYDRHIPEMTVRETIDFSGRCQGVGSRAGEFLVSFSSKT